MNHVIIGTAGHVDHGKTTLIKALTGIDTDRLKEEKDRGITIEPGFAFFVTERGQRVGVIDVPGHEKFIKNMLGGAASVDIALVIVAADEGIMPQTIEHLDILSLLQVKSVVVALTKCDLVDDEWMEMVKEDLDLFFKKNYPFAKNALICPVSAASGQGITQLKAVLTDLVERADKKDLTVPFRLSVDRVFVPTGHGVVVTGTVMEGTIRAGDEGIIYPTETEVKIKSIQNHTQKVDEAFAGQRAAINLGGVGTGGVQKGDWLGRLG